MLLKFVLPLLLSSTFLSGQIADGPSARYTFNGNSKDEISGSSALLYNTSPSKDRFGNAASSYYIKGNIDSYINLGKSKALKPERGSISLWVKINTVTYNGKGVAGNPILITKSYEGEDFNEAYAIGYNFNLRHITVNTSLSELQQAYVHPDKTTSLREWHHVAMTYDDHFLCMYLDGVMEGKVTKGFKSSFLESDSVLIGICVDKKNVRFLCGSVDDIEIYNRVLSPEEIQKLYEAPDPNTFKTRLQGIFLVMGAILLVLLCIWLIRRYISQAIKKEKDKDLLKIQWYEHENRALKAQMNPHFIFNSLNTIQQFIISNENKKAQLYLSKFSRLIRKLLESNINDKIRLSEELDLCEKYLEIESLRFNNVFKYSILMKGEVDASSILLPNFLVQPFIENALWHGLLPKKEDDKQLIVVFEISDEFTLSVTIDDNGVGRKNKKLSEGMEPKKSLAISFIRQRLLLFSKIYGRAYSAVILDKTNAQGESEGTQVILKLPIIHN